MLIALLMLAAAPVSLKVDLSRSTTERLGPRLRTLIEERLSEEGFVLEPGAKVQLSVEELHGTLRLTAKAGDYSANSELRPALEWPAELGFELAQRLAVLAHDAEMHVPVPTQVTTPAPEMPPEAEPVQEELKPPPDSRLRLGAGFRIGVLVRGGGIDPSLGFHGLLPGVVEPMVSMGLTFAPGRGLSAWELPLLGGLRVPIHLGSWTLLPELLVGGRLHFYGASSLDAGGVRFDPLGTLAMSFLRTLGELRLGARLGFEVSTAREHLLGDEVLWSRGGFGFSAMIQLER